MGTAPDTDYGIEDFQAPTLSDLLSEGARAGYWVAFALAVLCAAGVLR